MTKRMNKTMRKRELTTDERLQNEIAAAFEGLERVGLATSNEVRQVTKRMQDPGDRADPNESVT